MKETWLHGGANALENQGHLSSGAAAMRQQRLELLGGSAGAPATNARRAAASPATPPAGTGTAKTASDSRCVTRGLVLLGELFPHPCRQRLHLNGQESTAWEWAMGASPVGTVGQGRGQGVPGAVQTWAWGLAGTRTGKQPRGGKSNAA